MSVWSQIWAELRKPSDFRDDWFVYAAGQIVHATFWGFGGCTLLALLCSLVFPGWPDQRVVFGAVVLAYALVWEWGVQGWRGWDGFEDTAFVAIGASGFLLIDMSLVIWETACVFVGIVAALAPGIYKRAKGAEDGKQ